MKVQQIACPNCNGIVNINIQDIETITAIVHPEAAKERMFDFWFQYCNHCDVKFAFKKEDSDGKIISSLKF